MTDYKYVIHLGKNASYLRHTIFNQFKQIFSYIIYFIEENYIWFKYISYIFFKYNQLSFSYKFKSIC